MLNEIENDDESRSTLSANSRHTEPNLQIFPHVHGKDEMEHVFLNRSALSDNSPRSWLTPSYAEVEDEVFFNSLFF